MEERPGGEAIEAVVGVDEGHGEELPAAGGVHFLRDFYFILAISELHVVSLYACIYLIWLVIGGGQECK